MIKIWYNRVVLRKILFSEVDEKYKEAVRLLLIENGREDLINE